MKNEIVYMILEARFQNALNEEDNIYFVSLRMLQLGNIAKIRHEFRIYEFMKFLHEIFLVFYQINVEIFY